MSSTFFHRWKSQPSRFFGTVYVPVCVLSVRDTAGAWRDIEVVVDSGAAVTLLKRSFGDFLGIDVMRGRPLSLSGIAGSAVETRVHEMRVRLGHIEMGIPVAIATDDRPPNLLGRVGVFDRLRVEFSGGRRQTVFADE